MAVVALCSLGTLSMSSCMVTPTATGSPSGNYASGSSAAGYSYGSGGNSAGGAYSNSYGSSPASGSYASAGTSADSGSSGSSLSGYSKNTSQSDALTRYLQRNRLPLVGAQVLSNNQGNREIILYGFVATDFGKRDAVAKARRYLNDPRATVENRIVVRPELLASGPSAPSSSGGGTYDPNAASSGKALGSVQSYENQAQTQQYMAQQNSAINMLLPLIGMMGLLSLGNSSFGMGYSGVPPTTYGSPYSTPYGSPYGPYRTPYPPGYGYPRGFSPYP